MNNNRREVAGGSSRERQFRTYLSQEGTYMQPRTTVVDEYKPRQKHLSFEEQEQQLSPYRCRFHESTSAFVSTANIRRESFE